MRLAPSAALLFALSSPAAAQGSSPAPCSQILPAPAPFGGWRARQPLVAATRVADVGRAMLRIGHGVDAILADDVRFAAPPHASDGKGGLFAFVVPAAARYRMALGGPVRVDVVKDGGIRPSVAHAHGPACTGIRKTVDFDLAPGRYLLQVAASAEPRVAVLIARVD